MRPRRYLVALASVGPLWVCNGMTNAVSEGRPVTSQVVLRSTTIAVAYVVLMGAVGLYAQRRRSTRHLSRAQWRLVDEAIAAGRLLDDPVLRRAEVGRAREQRPPTRGVTAAVLACWGLFGWWVVHDALAGPTWLVLLTSAALALPVVLLLPEALRDRTPYDRVLAAAEGEPSGADEEPGGTHEEPGGTDEGPGAAPR